MPAPRVLTELDEWPRHQTIDTFDMIANPSPGWSDGYWHCVGDPDGEVNLITALRLYHNTNVIDAYAILSTGEGRQYNVRATRRLRPNIDELRVGPFSQEIIRGLRTLRLGLDENPHDVSFDILWESSAPPYDECPGVRTWVDGRLAGERSNLVQLGDLSGWIRVGGKEYRFEAGDGWVGAKDHSWGQANTGEGEQPNRHAAPVERRRSPWGSPGARWWSLVGFPDRSLYLSFRHRDDGTLTAAGTGGAELTELGRVHSRIDYPYGSGREGWAYADLAVSDIEFEDGFPRLKSARLDLTRPDGGLDRFLLETVSKPVYMQGGGYWGGWDDGLGRGVYRGDLVEGEVWDVSHPVIVRDLNGAEVRQRPGGHYAELYTRYANLDDPDDVGLGLQECVFIGEYQGIKAM